MGDGVGKIGVGDGPAFRSVAEGGSGGATGRDVIGVQDPERNDAVSRVHLIKQRLNRQAELILEMQILLLLSVWCVDEPKKPLLCPEDPERCKILGSTSTYRLIGVSETGPIIPLFTGRNARTRTTRTNGDDNSSWVPMEPMAAAKHGIIEVWRDNEPRGLGAASSRVRHARESTLACARLSFGVVPRHRAGSRKLSLDLHGRWLTRCARSREQLRATPGCDMGTSPAFSGRPAVLDDALK